jgi:hypothetical protein
LPTIAGVGSVAMLALLVGLFAGGMTAASAATSPANALKAYQKCLASHGVKNLPRGAGGFGGGGFGGGFGRGQNGPNGQGAQGGEAPSGSAPTNGTRPAAPKLTSKQKKAVKACQSKLPKGGFRGGAGGPGGPGGGQFQAQIQAYLTCLTQHGVSIPSGGGFRNLDQSDPTVQAAETACAAQRPSFGRPGGAGGQGGNGQAPTNTTAPAAA